MKEHLVDEVNSLLFYRTLPGCFYVVAKKIKRSLVTVIRMRETVTEMATGCLNLITIFENSVIRLVFYK